MKQECSTSLAHERLATEYRKGILGRCKDEKRERFLGKVKMKKECFLG